MTQPIIGFAGMTHLGINSAVATAERTFNVICYDPDVSLIGQLRKKILPVVEPTLPALFKKNIENNRLTVSNETSQLAYCDIVYLSSDVPTDENGHSHLSSIHRLIEKIAAHLNETALLIILCQVPPGFTQTLKKLIPLSRLYYQVETLIFGKAVERALYPERFIVGCNDPTLPLDPRYRHLLESFECPILTMRYESAELAKIAINCCLVASIGVANTLSELCEQIGAEWSEIIPALKLDKRIGQHAYLSPGLGIAGGNLERDLITLLELSSRHGTENSIVKSWIYNSQYRKNWVLRTLHQCVISNNPTPTLAVLGLSYKENTHSIKNSPSLALLASLKSYLIRVYDPVVPASMIAWAQPKASIDEALQDVDVLIIMTPWPQFKTITAKNLKQTMRGNIIIDPYGLLKNANLKKEGFQYLTLGSSHVKTFT